MERETEGKERQRVKMERDTEGKERQRVKKERNTEVKREEKEHEKQRVKGGKTDRKMDLKPTEVRTMKRQIDRIKQR